MGASVDLVNSSGVCDGAAGLAEPESRGVVQVARNLLEGAAVLTRAQQLRSVGGPNPPAAFDFRPRALG